MTPPQQLATPPQILSTRFQGALGAGAGEEHCMLWKYYPGSKPEHCLLTVTSEISWNSKVVATLSQEENLYSIQLNKLKVAETVPSLQVAYQNS